MAEMLFHYLGITQVPAVDVRAILKAVKSCFVFLDLILQQTCVRHIAHASVQLDPSQSLFNGGDLQLTVTDRGFLEFREDPPPFFNLLLDCQVSFII